MFQWFARKVFPSCLAMSLRPFALKTAAALAVSACEFASDDNHFVAAIASAAPNLATSLDHNADELFNA